jgi:outer membrane immunogenic protein
MVSQPKCSEDITCFMGAIPMSGRLISIICRAAFIFAASGSAFAADMAVKAPAPEPAAPVYTWTGWYGGLNFGGAWGAANNNISFTQTDTLNSPASFNAQDSGKFNGPFGGIQAGYNWQVSNFLLGFETDIQASGQTGTNNFNGTIFSVGAPNPATGTDNEKLDWFGTVRGRLGLRSIICWFMEPAVLLTARLT